MHEAKSVVEVVVLPDGRDFSAAADLIEQENNGRN